METSYRSCGCGFGGKLLLVGAGLLLGYALFTPGCKAEYQRVKSQPMETTIKEYDQKLYKGLNKTGDKIVECVGNIETKIKNTFERRNSK